MDFILSAVAWPVWVAVVLMAVAACIHLLIDVVPNGLAVGTAVTALITAGLISSGLAAARGGLGSAFACLLISFVVMLALHMARLAPGGTAKMHVAYCTWLGCAAPVGPAMLTTLLVTGAVIAAGAVGFALGLRERRVEERHLPVSDGSLTRVTISLQSAASAAAVLGTLLADLLGVL
jgi:hypothetical protein